MPKTGTADLMKCASKILFYMSHGQVLNYLKNVGAANSVKFS